MWENCRPLRERAIRGKTLVASVDDAVQPTPPSLENMSKNHTLLKGFTSYMAATGVICTSHIDPVKKAVVGFYTLMQCDVETDAGVTVCHEVAKSIKRMLTIIRFKWRRWEMPRDPKVRDLVQDLAKASDKAFKEGRSPFIFKADEESNKKGRPNIDDISDTEAASDFTIRDTLSRSCSSLEEEQEKSLAELRALAMADASGFNPEQDDTLPMDSQPVEDDAGFHSKEPAACEVVDVDGDQPDSAAAGPAGPQPDAVMALLQLVKAKISTHEQSRGSTEPTPATASVPSKDSKELVPEQLDALAPAATPSCSTPQPPCAAYPDPDQACADAKDGNKAVAKALETSLEEKEPLNDDHDDGIDDVKLKSMPFLREQQLQLANAKKRKHKSGPEDGREDGDGECEDEEEDLDGEEEEEEEVDLPRRRRRGKGAKAKAKCKAKAKAKGKAKARVS
ncbi:unnamed protein product [Cladocopium goreaui]|uniref:Uncharacterized protein n=2 Tax=Cladocopium goreaui TaxID=2562237 RepID=A0A9P1FVQ9_9DINO|nr:unnamed protein product [Cladocopium goreaui]